MSFDIADYCTLKCPYCYWAQSTQHQELSCDEIVKITREEVERGVIHATWIGGEPTLRPDVLEAVTPLVPTNWIVTNGVEAVVRGYEKFDAVRDLGDNTWVIVSLDGVGEAHDISRGRSGVYEQILRRFHRTFRSRRTLTTTTLYQGNKNQPALLLEHWRKSSILGMTFDFATPIGRMADSKWDLVGEDRDRVIDELIVLKKRYGSFMKNSIWALEMQRTRNLQTWAGPTCPCTLVLSLDSLGRKKEPCVLGSSPLNSSGKRPDCGSCGCHVPLAIMGMQRLEWETMKANFWFLE